MLDVTRWKLWWKFRNNHQQCQKHSKTSKNINKHPWTSMNIHKLRWTSAEKAKKTGTTHRENPSWQFCLLSSFLQVTTVSETLIYRMSPHSPPSHPHENASLAAAPLVRPPFSGAAAVSLFDPARLFWQAQWQLHEHNKQQLVTPSPKHCSYKMLYHHKICNLQYTVLQKYHFIMHPVLHLSDQEHHPGFLPNKVPQEHQNKCKTMHKKSNKCKRMQKDAKGGVESREKMTKLSDKTVRKKDLKQEGIIHVGGESS